jgi:hypothetical protein
MGSGHSSLILNSPPTPAYQHESDTRRDDHDDHDNDDQR